MRTRGSHILLIALVLAGALGGLAWRGTPGRAEDDGDTFPPGDKSICLGCHEEKINDKSLVASAHGRLTCTNCHTGIDRYPHPDKATFKPKCETCHGNRMNDLAHSVHGKQAGRNQGSVPTCQTCHGMNPHEIVKLSTLPVPQKVQVCQSCHADKAAALARSIHGQQSKTSMGTAPNCLSCHGGNPHTIKPPDPVQTTKSCWTCHTDIADALAASVHGKTDGRATNRLNCLNCHGNDAHALQPPSKTLENPLQDASCRRCHADKAAKLASSAHGQGGKHLSCLACHGGSPHAITVPKHLNPDEMSALCEKCHPESTRRLVGSAHGMGGAQPGQKLNCLSCHGGDQHAVTPPDKVPALQKAASCEKCHPQKKDEISHSIHATVTADGGKRTSCLICHESNPKSIVPYARATREQKEAPCLACHADHGGSPDVDVHRRPDKQPGDHPTCLSCHGGSPHTLQKPQHRTPKERIALCAGCHSDAALMKRYGLLTNTVEAYEATFHGKAVLKMGVENAANCTDCHGLHAIMAPDNPNAPTTPQNAPHLCAKCHKGNMKDFAYSYAGHFRLGVEQSVITPLEKFTLGLMGLCAFGWLFLIGILGVRNRRITDDGFYTSTQFVEFYDGLWLFAVLMGVTVLAVAIAMRLAGNPVSTITLVSPLLVLGAAVVVKLVKPFIFPKS